MLEFLTAGAFIVGIALILLGAYSFKATTTSSEQPVEVNVPAGKFSLPVSNKGLVFLFVGLFLVWMSIDLFKEGGTLQAQSNNFFISTAYAQNHNDEGPDWVYFGYADDSNLWRYTFLKGNLQDLNTDKRSEVILKAKKDEKVFNGHYEDFHGTKFDFLSGAYPDVKSYSIKADSCIAVKEYVSVGFSKIWLRVDPVPCN